MKMFESSNFQEIQVDMEDFEFTQEDLRAITLLETSIVQEDSQLDLQSSDSYEQLHIPKKRRRLIIRSE